MSSDSLVSAAVHAEKSAEPRGFRASECISASIVKGQGYFLLNIRVLYVGFLTLQSLRFTTTHGRVPILSCSLRPNKACRVPNRTTAVYLKYHFRCWR